MNAQRGQRREEEEEEEEEERSRRRRRQEDDDDDGDDNYRRPRRPDPDTISYLRSLPLNVEVASEEIDRFVASSSSSEEEYPRSLAAALSALDDVRDELASLAGDGGASETIEVLARIACPYSEVAARRLLAGLSGYCLHLSTHRYGSHVLQTALELSALTAPSETTDLALRDGAPPVSAGDDEHDDPHLPSLSELLAGIQEELSPRASDLAVHVCGSHVLRTLACVLGGVELIQPQQQRGGGGGGEECGGGFRRGKTKPKKKKGKKKNAAAETETFGGGGSHNDSTRIRHAANSRILRDGDGGGNGNPILRGALTRLVEAVTGGGGEDDCRARPPGELQRMACNASSSPLLIVMLRVLTYADDRRDRRRDGGASEDERNDGGAFDPTEEMDYHHLALLRPEPKFRPGSDAHALARRLLCWQQHDGSQVVVFCPAHSYSHNVYVI